MKKIIRVLIVVVLAMSLLAACAGGNSNSGGNDTAGNSNTAGSGNQGSTDGGSGNSNSSAEPAKDTITALLPPVSGNFQSYFEDIKKEFNEKYPNLTLEIEPASWEDMTQKLDTQVNAGNPPDIAFIGSGSISKYVDLGMAVDISGIATEEMLADYNETALNYMRLGDGLYGLPAYMEVHALGGNRQFMEEAGIDWQSVQQNGWTYEEFREAIRKGTVRNENGEVTRYGFVFANAGVTSRDYLTILSKNAGMPHPFDENLKYTYTSKNFLVVLQAVREMIDDGSMPKELSSIDAGKRWNMFLTGQTMITGKGLATFENSANINNEKLRAKDGSAVEGSIEVEYIVLPVPTFAGAEMSSATVVDGYVIFRGKDEPTQEHLENVVKAANFLSSGKWAAIVNNDLFAAHITKSAQEYAKDIPVERNPANIAAVEMMLEHATPARPDIPAELSAEAIKLEDEVIIPKFQALLAGEITPEEMYEEVKAAAIEVFGEDGVVLD